MVDDAPSPAPAPAADAPMVAALRGLEVSDWLFAEFEQFPDEKGEILLGFALDSYLAGWHEQARSLFEVLREHPTSVEDGQRASVELARVLRACGETARADRITSELLGSDDLGARPAAVLAGDLQKSGMPTEALHCYEIACRGLLDGPVEDLGRLSVVARQSLVGRAAVRRSLGVEADTHDEAVFASPQWFIEGHTGYGNEGPWKTTLEA